MAEEELEKDDTDLSEPQEGEKVGGKKKLIIIIGAVVLLLLIGAGLFFSGVLGGGEAKEEKPEGEEAAAAAEAPLPAHPTFYELPEFLVNLQSSGKHPSFVKMKISVELTRPEEVAKLELYMPRVMDGVNTYLRDLRASDLAGSAGTARLREELLLRLNKAVEGVKVNNIYITTFQVQ